MKRISILNWLNLVASIFCFITAIVDLCNDKLVIGITLICLSLLNLYVFLAAISNIWDVSDKVHTKFIFTCPRCKHTFVPCFWRWFLVPHIGSRRYFKCAACGKRSYMRRK